MELIVGLVIAAITGFAIISAAREIVLYRRAVQGEVYYLVSKQRRNRRLRISAVLLIEAVFLFLGFFVLDFSSPGMTLLFWLPPLLLIGVVVNLTVQDFRETSHDLDQIVRESLETILRKAREKFSTDKHA